MTREEAIEYLAIEYLKYANATVGKKIKTRVAEALEMAIKSLEQEPVLDKLRAEIKEKIEQEEFARSVFRHEEKDTAKAEQCTGSIMAYNNVIKLIDKYKADRSEENGNDD